MRKRQVKTSRRLGRRILTAAERLEDKQLLAADAIVVTTQFDVVDANDGLTSFREALALAENQDGHDRIVFDRSLEFSNIYRGVSGIDADGKLITELSADSFLISSEVTIDGSTAGFVRIGGERGRIVYGRVIEVAADAYVEIKNAIVEGGYLNLNFGAPGPVDRGGVDDGGAGILNRGTLKLMNSAVGSNHVVSQLHGASQNGPPDRGGYALGGGIRNLGELTLQNSHVGELLVDSEFLADIGADARVYEEQESREAAALKSSTPANNHALYENGSDEPTRLSGNVADGFGAGIYNLGTLHVTQGSIIDGNRARFDGGGIYNAGNVTIDESIVRNNRLSFMPFGVDSRRTGGGGIFNGGSVEIVGSQIVENEAHQSNGGGIYNRGVLEITDSTLRDNWVANQGGFGGGGGIYDVGIKTSIEASTFVGNVAPNGGAVHNHGNPSLLVSNSTLTENRAAGPAAGFFGSAHGAGIYHLNGVETTPNTQIVSSTIVRNSSIANSHSPDATGRRNPCGRW